MTKSVGTIHWAGPRERGFEGLVRASLLVGSDAGGQYQLRPKGMGARELLCERGLRESAGGGACTGAAKYSTQQPRIWQKMLDSSKGSCL